MIFELYGFVNLQAVLFLAFWKNALYLRLQKAHYFERNSYQIYQYMQIIQMPCSNPNCYFSSRYRRDFFLLSHRLIIRVFWDSVIVMRGLNRNFNVPPSSGQTSRIWRILTGKAFPGFMFWSIEKKKYQFKNHECRLLFFLEVRYLFGNIDFTFLFRFKFANHLTKEPYVSPANKAFVGTLISIGDEILCSRNFRRRQLGNCENLCEAKPCDFLKKRFRGILGSMCYVVLFSSLLCALSSTERADWAVPVQSSRSLSNRNCS